MTTRERMLITDTRYWVHSCVSDRSSGVGMNV